MPCTHFKFINIPNNGKSDLTQYVNSSLIREPMLPCLEVNIVFKILIIFVSTYLFTIHITAHSVFISLVCNSDLQFEPIYKLSPENHSAFAKFIKFAILNRNKLPAKFARSKSIRMSVLAVLAFVYEAGSVNRKAKTLSEFYLFIARYRGGILRQL